MNTYITAWALLVKPTSNYDKDYIQLNNVPFDIVIDKITQYHNSKGWVIDLDFLINQAKVIYDTYERNEQFIEYTKAVNKVIKEEVIVKPEYIQLSLF